MGFGNSKPVPQPKPEPELLTEEQVWSVVQTSAAESFIPKLKTLNDVKFNKDTEEQVMADLCMKRERHRAMKMAIPMEEIMTFVSEFFGPEGEGLPEKHVSQLKTVAKHSLKSAIQENTFTVTNNQLELSSYFVAFKKHDNMMYMVIAVSHFEGEFPTDLNTDRRKNLELLLMVKALRNINANMTIPTSMLDSNAQEIFLNLVIGIKPPTEDEGEPVKPVACVET